MGIIAERLQKARDIRQISTNRLYEKVRVLIDVSKNTVYGYVNGRVTPPPDFMAAAAGVLGVEESWLYGFGPMNRSHTEAHLTDLAHIGRLPDETDEETKMFWEAFYYAEYYKLLTPTVQTLFHNAHARNVLYRTARASSEAEREPLGPEERAEEARRLYEELMAEWRHYREAESRKPPTGDDPLLRRKFSDYAIARLHAAMLAMPARNTRRQDA